MAMLDIEMTRLDTETCPDVAAMERSPLAMAAPKEAKDQDALKLVEYIAEEDKVDKILENQHLIRTPIVRNGKQSTVGHQPEIWKEWCN